MSIRSRSRWIAAATAVAIPAIVLSTACSSDKAAAPASVATADTVALNPSNETLVEWWGNSSDSGYYSYSGEDDDYVQTYDNGSGNFYFDRLLMQFALPKLAGKGVVDSAKMYDYACAHNTAFTDSIVVDHVNWGAAYSDSASWGSQVLQANVGTLVRDTTTGWKTVNISSSVQADYAAKRPNTQYRLEWLYQTVPSSDVWVEFAGGDCEENGSNGAAGQAYMVIWAH
jgi:hypothetical protein